MRKILFLLLIVMLSLVLGKPIILTWPQEEWSIAKVNERLILELNLWNLRSAKGSAVMVFNKGMVVFSANLYDITQITPEGWVTGYPEIFYGYKPWNKYYVKGRWLKLPVRIKNLPPVYLVVNYTLWFKKPLSLNMAYDLWITRKKFSKGIGEGDIELMIWLFHTNLAPAGKEVGSFTIPVFINNRRQKITWEVWVGEFQWTVVTFKTNKPLKGKIKFKLNKFITITNTVIKRLKNKSIFNHFLEDIELGTEFGNPDAKEAIFGWMIFSFKISKK